MRLLKLTFTALLLMTTAAVFSFGRKDKAEDAQAWDTQSAKSEIKNEYLSIDMLLDTQKENARNHLNWRSGAVSHKDYFDAVSGASKLHSTKNLRELTADPDSKSSRIPKGLRSLCLFAVSDSKTLSKDNFSITADGKKLTITFSHRGISYKIESDDGGRILVPEGFSIIFPPDTGDDSRPQDGQQTEIAREKNVGEESAALRYEADAPGEAVAAIYKGSLRSSLSQDGILTLKGKLRLAPNERPAQESAHDDESARDEQSVPTEQIEGDAPTEENI